MASQVAHIVYASKYLEKYPMNNTEEFFIGVCFPDIRRIQPRIKRSETHMIISDLNAELRYLEPFQAGWKFHLFCDMRREEILNKMNFYELGNSGALWNLPNKHLEDEIIYDSYQNWEKIINLFNNPPLIDLPNFISRDIFEIWYAILAKYFERKPDDESMRVFMKKQSKLAEMADDILRIVDKLRKDDKVVKLLSEVKDEIAIGL